MNAGFSVDPAVLLAGLLLLVGVIGGGVASRFRIPSLLLFLVLGMSVADEGLALVRFDDALLAQNVATVALAIILFEGGLGTEPSAFRKDGVAAAALATFGVAITAGVVAGAAWLLTDVEPVTALLLGSVVASTDAAAVFAALRSEPLPERTQRLLQLESGMNDPVAILLTIGMVEVWAGDPGPLDWVTFLALQLVVGVVVGVSMGVVGRWIIGHVTGAAASSLGVVTLAIAALSYGSTAVIGGSGFLAVYLTGVIVAGNQRSTRTVLYFHEGLAATAQAVLFLLLGMLVFPTELVDDLGAGIIVAGALVFLARPLAVAAVLVWSRTPVKRMAVISWGGLRGAVPVVLATIPFTAGHPDGALIFDVAFVVVVLSIAVQAPTVGALARRLGEVAEQQPALRPEIVGLDSQDADLIELTIPIGSGIDGLQLQDAPLPDGARVSIIRRDEATLIPHGDTTLLCGDVLLLVASRSCELQNLEEWSKGHPGD